MHEYAHGDGREELDLHARLVHHLAQRGRDDPPVGEAALALVVLLDEEAPVLELEPEQVCLPAAEAAVVVAGQELRRFRTNGRMPPAL